MGDVDVLFNGFMWSNCCYFLTFANTISFSKFGVQCALSIRQIVFNCEHNIADIDIPTRVCYLLVYKLNSTPKKCLCQRNIQSIQLKQTRIQECLNRNTKKIFRLRTS